nr:EamA family transporter [Sneathiella glossodoripedis]
MAAGTVLSRKWSPPVSLLTFTSWQLTAGGILLIPLTLLLEPEFPTLDGTNLLGLVYLGLIGAAFTYILWFRGIAKIDPTLISTLGFLSPTTAVVLGWAALDETLSLMQLFAIFLVLFSILLSQQAPRLQSLKLKPFSLTPLK